MRYPFNRKFKPRRPGLPNPKEYGAGGVYWVSTIMTGVEEFEAYRLRMIPYAEILELDIGRPLAELHSTTEGVARYE